MQSIQFYSNFCSFQWILEDSKDANTLLNNPDSIVDWEQVAMIMTSIPNCPICLTEPTIPKCTKCGHIYCWTCILQYLQNNHKCPICFQYVASDELKSVIGKKQPDYETNRIRMTLLKRKSVL